MAISQTITDIPTPPSSSDATNFRTRADAFMASLDTLATELNTFRTQANALETNVNNKEASAQASKNSAAVSELNAQASANFKGVWNSNTPYITGQSVLGSDNAFYVALQNSTNQNPTSTTGYWKINVPLGAIGNITSPLLDMPLKNSLAMKAGVGSATFTRASTATYIDRYGVLKTAAIDEPRFEKEGYLNEGDSTNLCLYSEDFSNALWLKTNTNVASNTTDTLDPYGTSLADKISFTDTTGNIAQNVTSSGTAHTFSIFVKKGVGSFITLRTVGYDTTTNYGFNLDTLTAESSGKIVELSNGWLRLSITTTLIGTDLTGAVYVYSPSIMGGINAVIGNYVYIFGAQLEALPFATSYIPTVASTVTRSVDILRVSMPNNSPKGTFAKTVLVDFLPKSLAQIDGRIFDFQSISYNMIRIDANVVQSFYGGGALTNYIPSLTVKSRWGYIVNNNIQDTSSNSISNYSNGVLINTQSSGAISQSNIVAGTSIVIGSGQIANGSSPFNGHITNFRIYDKALTAQEVALA